MRVGRGRFFCFRELRWKKRDLFRERRARFGKARRRWTKKAKQRGKKHTSLAKGSFLISSSVERWYLRISRRATAPGR